MRGARLWRRKALARRQREKRQILVSVEAVLWGDLFQHKRRHRGDAGHSDLFILEFFESAVLGPGHQPLQHLIVHGQDGFERSIALSDGDQGAAPGAGEIHFSSEHGLKAGGGCHDDDIEIDPFLLHITPILGERKDDELKRFGWQGDIDFIEAEYRFAGKQQNADQQRRDHREDDFFHCSVPPGNNRYRAGTETGHDLHYKSQLSESIAEVKAWQSTSWLDRGNQCVLTYFSV